MIRLQLATRADVMASGVTEAIRAATRATSDGVGIFAKEGSDPTSRTRVVEATVADAVAGGWVSVPGFLVSVEGHVFHVL